MYYLYSGDKFGTALFIRIDCNDEEIKAVCLISNLPNYNETHIYTLKMRDISLIAVTNVKAAIHRYDKERTRVRYMKIINQQYKD